MKILKGLFILLSTYSYCQLGGLIGPNNSVPNLPFYNIPSVSQFKSMGHPELDAAKGKMDITIPIFELTIDENKTIPIAFQYNTKGVIVEDAGSEMGTNWDLRGKGMIVRKVHGIPDEMKKQVYLERDVGINGTGCWESKIYDNAGWLYSKTKVNQFIKELEVVGIDSAGIFTASNGIKSSDFAKNIIDAGPDEFAVLLPDGRTFSFFITANGEIKTADNSQFKIEYAFPVLNNDDGFERFTITDEEGYVYVFANAERSKAYIDENHFAIAGIHGYYKTVPVRPINSIFFRGLYNLQAMAINWMGINFNGFHPDPIINQQMYNEYMANFVSYFLANTFICGRVYTEETTPIITKAFANAWYITSIQSPNESLFSTRYYYKPVTISHLQNSKHSTSVDNRRGGHHGDATQSSNDFSLISTHQISEIVNNQSTIKFNYGEVREDMLYTNIEQDLPFSPMSTNAKRLNSIDIINNAKPAPSYTEVKTRSILLRQNYVLSQDYHSNIPSQNLPLFKRLYLNGLDFVDLKTNKQETYYFHYNDKERLPNKFSFEQDYWGYYNYNGAMSLLPNLWFLPAESIENTIDRGKVLLYPKDANSKTVYEQGNYYPSPDIPTVNNYYATTENVHRIAFGDRRPNENFLKKGMLTKIVYPTKGSLELDYEINKFKYHESEVDGSGLRIKETRLKDGDKTLTRQYEYKLENGSSSGMVESIPRFGKIGLPGAELVPSPSAVGYYNPPPITKIDLYSIPINIGENFDVIYVRVKITDVKDGNYNGYIEKKFKMNKDVSKLNFPLPNTDYISSVFTTHRGGQFLISLNPPVGYRNIWDYGPFFRESSFEIINGLPEEINIYNSQNQLISQKKYDYNIKSITSVQNITKRFNSVIRNKGITSVRFLNPNLITKTERYRSSPSSPFLEDVTTFSYNNANFIKEIESRNTLNEVVKTKYEYVADQTIPMTTPMADLSNRHMMKTVIKEESFNNNSRLYKKTYNYDFVTKQQICFDLGFPFPPCDNYPTYPVVQLKSISTQKGDMPESTNVTYNRYGLKDQIEEYTLENGTPVSIIWGYGGVYPIAKIEGITYANLITLYNVKNLQKLSAEDIDVSSENILRTALEGLRTQSNLQHTYITTYTYDPQLGVTSITQPNGQRETYEYDGLGRLLQVKDTEGRVTKKIEYNTKN